MVQSAQESYVQLKDGKVFFLKQGKGYPLVMLHAADFGSWTWNRVLGPLARSFTCYALDMPGFDRSDSVPQAYSIRRFAEAVAEFMDKAGIPRAHLLGHRTGAVVSLELAVTHPQRVNRLVLEGCLAWTREEGQFVLERWLKPNLNQYGGVGPLTYEEAVKWDPQVDRAWVEKVAEASRKYGKWITVTHEAAMDYDVPENAAKAKVPTLIVYGDKDVVRKKERLNTTIKGSIMKSIPNVATPHYETPDLFVQEVTSFLQAK
ncbi:MAG: alpha/beta hydrolase [Chloroflexi bacterium]|nr:alpha/beta hydrolase [Chloroflexota bacterium]